MAIWWNWDPITRQSDSRAGALWPPYSPPPVAEISLELIYCMTQSQIFSQRHCLVVLSLILFIFFSSSIFMCNQAMIFLFNQKRSIMDPLQIYISFSRFSSYFSLLSFFSSPFNGLHLPKVPTGIPSSDKVCRNKSLLCFGSCSVKGTVHAIDPTSSTAGT